VAGFFVLFCFCSAKDQSQDFAHTRQILYHWAISLVIGFLRLFESQTGLDLLIFLPPLPKCWDYRLAPHAQTGILSCSGNTRFWTQGLRFSRQVLYHLSHSCQPCFCVGYFWDRVFQTIMGVIDQCLAQAGILNSGFTDKLRGIGEPPETKGGFSCSWKSWVHSFYHISKKSKIYSKVSSWGLVKWLKW
jgi:hypothetical protein